MCEVCFIRHRENGPGFSTRWTSASATSPASYTTFEELKFEILLIHVSPSQERERIQSTSPFRLLPIAIEKRTTSFFDPCFACLFLCCSYSRLQPVQACLDLANLKTSISMVKTWDASITSSGPMHFLAMLCMQPKSWPYGTWLSSCTHQTSGFHERMPHQTSMRPSKQAAEPNSVANTKQCKSEQHCWCFNVYRKNVTASRWYDMTWHALKCMLLTTTLYFFILLQYITKPNKLVRL